MSHRSFRRRALDACTVLSLSVAAGCAGSANGEPPAAGQTETDVSATQETPMNTLSEAERAAGWELLFDGETLNGWRSYHGPDLPDGWAAVDGTLARTGSGGDIITDREFGDFELRVEWRLEPGGNSGIFYRAAEGEEWVYHSAPEYQVLDDERHPDGGSLLTSAGANYGLHATLPGVARPAGEWNEARIVVRGDQVQHWLNETLVVEYELGSPEWQALVAGSKFSQWPAYGQAERGHIGLQDHGDPVWYRNIKVRVIE